MSQGLSHNCDEVASRASAGYQASKSLTITQLTIFMLTKIAFYRIVLQ